MKVQSRPASVMETIGDTGAAGPRAQEYGQAFENHVRDASQGAKTKAQAAKPQDGKGAAPEREAASGAASQAEKDELKRLLEKEDAEAASADKSGAEILDLSKLVTAFAAKAQGKAGRDGETDAGTAGAERVSVNVAAGSDEAEGGGRADVVRLQVLRMETHFEPETRNMVLVEGETPEGGAKTSALDAALAASQAQAALAAAAAAKGAEDEAGPKLSFDQMLRRLDRMASDKNGTSGEADLSVEVSTDRSERGTRAEARQAAGARADALAQRSQAADDAATSSFAAIVSAGASAGEGKQDPLAGIASLTTQVAGRIVDSFGSLGDGRGQADLPPGEAHLRMRAGGAALKTLTIQLQPESMGKLEVAMRLVDGQLTLELAASEPETARALANDRDGLRKLLEHAGFSLDDGSIAIVARDVLPGAARTDTGSGQSQGGQSQGGQSQGGASGQNGAGAQGEAAGQSGREARGEESAPRERPSGRAGETPSRAASGTYL